MIPKGKAAAKLKIQVLAGGISHERDISLKSGRRVADALTEFGATVVIREPDSELLANIAKDKPDVIWPVLHGASGEDGALRDILTLTGVPFVGATPEAARLAWDKSIAKILVARAGIQTPPSMEGGYLALIAQNLIGGRADRRLGHVADLVGLFCHRGSFT